MSPIMTGRWSQPGRNGRDRVATHRRVQRSPTPPSDHERTITVIDATIEVSGLRKRFGPTQALDGMTFTVPPGRLTGFVGPNGAGKSTTIRVILGLDAPDRRKDRTNVQVVMAAVSGSARVTASAMSIDNVSGDTHVFSLLPVVGTGTPNVVAVAPVVTPPAPASAPRRRSVRP